MAGVRANPSRRPPNSYRLSTKTSETQLAFERLNPTLKGSTKGERDMLGWALTFLVIAIIAGVLGFGGIAGASASIAQILFFIFLVLLVISLVMHFVRGAAR
jgi:uncharacterized membrane protein YtjA (UPF0391 family)